MKQKEVKIINLSVNKKLGIINACNLVFDKNNKLIVFKGAVGEGKTTLQTALQLGTQGQKVLTDNQLYGDIDTEIQLLDGDFNIWIGCKSKDKKLQYVLYTKDKDGKKIKEPVIDGIKATPSKYLEHLQTALTWNMDELTSANPSIQKKILLKLYQRQLAQIGVIFDKKHPDFGSSILGQIEKAEKNRDEKDYLRKTKGGIADDLKSKGFDPYRPETCPDLIDISSIEAKIKELEKEKILLTSEPEAKKQTALANIKANAAEVNNKCLAYNSKLKADFEKKEIEYNLYKVVIDQINDNLFNLKEVLQKLYLDSFYDDLKINVKFPKEIKKPDKPVYIEFDEKNQVKRENITELNTEGCNLLNEIHDLRIKYHETNIKEANINTSKIDKKIEVLERDKIEAKENNNIVDAINSFHIWRASNDKVANLKNEYVQLLAKVETGVPGLAIIPKDDEIFLMYDGTYDPVYFNNPKKEMRKLSSYSSTQKPVICLLIQNYLLSQKAKAMRYMYIDNIPIDNKTRLLLENMSKELNLSIFLNITGDFEQETLRDGEILIQGGDIFFK